MIRRSDTRRSVDRADRPSDEGEHAPESEQEKRDGEESKERPTQPVYKRLKVIVPLTIVLIIAAVVGVLYWLHARHFESTDDAFIDGRITQINPKVAGYVTSLLVDDNQPVTAGDLLLEIDPRDFEAALKQARAALDQARDQVKQAEAQIVLAEATEKSAEADVKSAEAVAGNAQQILDRAEAAERAVAGSVSAQEIDQDRANVRSSTAALNSARDKVVEAKARTAATRSDLATAQAKVREDEAAVHAAELNLSYTKIVAPVTGRVTHRAVEKGDYLEAGQALFALVQPHFWVTANFKETQLTHMKVGQPVIVRVDAYPGYDLKAHIDSFQRGTGAQFSLLPPENATGNYVKVVQRVPVKIEFDEPPPRDIVLGPGMSVVPRVTVR
jgi:membrane fusion protein (multidrug efflux system)